MSQKRGWGKTVMGWFVVNEDGDTSPPDAARGPSTATPGGDATVDDLIARYAGGPAAAAPAGNPATPPVQFTGELPKPQGGSLELPRIFAAAGISEEEQGRVVRAKELLRSLPAETPTPVKKQIVEASLKAFGYPIDDLIEASVQEIEALEAYIQHEAQETQRTLTDASARIEKLTAEIAELRKLMQQSMDEQATATQAANAAKLEIQQVLEFFGEEAVARVVKESPKLHEPPPQG